MIHCDQTMRNGLVQSTREFWVQNLALLKMLNSMKESKLVSQFLVNDLQIKFLCAVIHQIQGAEKPCCRNSCLCRMKYSTSNLKSPTKSGCIILAEKGRIECHAFEYSNFNW